MAKKGMGVIYTNDLDTKITNINNKYRKMVLKSYYDKYHHKLDKVTTTILKNNNFCIIIDFHSFSLEIVEKLFNIINIPDICIGIDYNYTNKKLINFTINHFKSYNYLVAINNPYSGTIIPNKFLNKQIYLNDKNSFYRLKKCIEDYQEKLKFLNF